MKRFRFQLETALTWRRQKEQAERARLEDMAARKAQLVARRREVEQQWLEAQAITVSRSSIEGGELAALDAYRRAAGFEQARIDGQLAALEQEIERQRQVLVEAGRQARLLEKLKETKHAAWKRETARLLEEEASELYLAQWARNQEP